MDDNSLSGPQFSFFSNDSAEREDSMDTIENDSSSYNKQQHADACSPRDATTGDEIDHSFSFFSMPASNNSASSGLSFSRSNTTSNTISTSADHEPPPPTAAEVLPDDDHHNNDDDDCSFPQVEVEEQVETDTIHYKTHHQQLSSSTAAATAANSHHQYDHDRSSHHQLQENHKYQKHHQPSPLVHVHAATLPLPPPRKPTRPAPAPPPVGKPPLRPAGRLLPPPSATLHNNSTGSLNPFGRRAPQIVHNTNNNMNTAVTATTTPSAGDKVGRATSINAGSSGGGIRPPQHMRPPHPVAPSAQPQLLPEPNPDPESQPQSELKQQSERHCSLHKESKGNESPALPTSMAQTSPEIIAAQTDDVVAAPAVTKEPTGPTGAPATPITPATAGLMSAPVQGIGFQQFMSNNRSTHDATAKLAMVESTMFAMMEAFQHMRGRYVDSTLEIAVLQNE